MKKIAIVANQMASGGTEVSLLNLLNKIHNKYDITLFLIKKRGVYSNDIPKNIKTIEIFDDENIKILDPLKNDDKHNVKLLIRKIFGKLYRKISFIRYCKYISKFSYKNTETYDYCIDFHGYGYFGVYYAINCIKANQKITFVHDENLEWIDPVVSEFKKFDKYFCVSNSCIKVLEKKYKFTKDKTELCRNVLNIKKIHQKAIESIDDFKTKYPIILTIGRLEYQKGYDLLLNVASILKNKKIDFKWYIIGGGSLLNEITEKINNMGLENEVKLLGIKKNPYPYIKKCDIYAQTSRHEGYGIAIAEARVLCKPIISTDLDCVREQLIDGKNGILSKYDDICYSDKLIDLILDKKLQKKLINNLQKESNEDTSDFELLLD